ncbi:hypothetical protein LTS18_006299 [Coniosporium uncinatum]|uniref:Uncharacterized protein n=1 Tax=Coniosporium uncinatum TaxID=93489 RepID=A0ACC3DXT0_9PEZI|nr:hypothetical protein LTS18_006299 [Coniosporium uncinatum]
MEQALKTFFSSPRFAVAGASSDPSKFGHKVLAWYLQHSLPVVPMNPRCPSVKIRSRSLSTLASPSSLPSPTETSLSIITPPAATLKVLREAKEAGVPAVWLQPGSFDAEGLEYARREFAAAIAGTEAGEDGWESRGGEGWCVLVDGERGLSAAGRGWERMRL